MDVQTSFSEADWEALVLDQLGENSWLPIHGDTIAPGTGERESWDELLIRPRLLAALRRLNPGVPDQYLQQACAEIIAPSSQDAITENHRIHQMFVDGYRLTYLDADGIEHNPTLRIIGSEEIDNDFLAVNQVTLVQGDYRRRFDVVLYCNGMPVSITELKKGRLPHSRCRRRARPATDLPARVPPGVSVLRVHLRLRRVGCEVRHPVYPAQPLLPLERRRRRRPRPCPPPDRRAGGVAD